MTRWQCCCVTYGHAACIRCRHGDHRRCPDVISYSQVVAISEGSCDHEWIPDPAYGGALRCPHCQCFASVADRIAQFNGTREGLSSSSWAGRQEPRMTATDADTAHCGYPSWDADNTPHTCTQPIDHDNGIHETRERRTQLLVQAIQEWIDRCQQ